MRPEYINEPSLRNSMFSTPLEIPNRNTKLEINPKMCVIMMIVAFICFGLATICFKAIYINYRHTIWEDIYGRGVVFFACSVIHYLFQKGE